MLLKGLALGGAVAAVAIAVLAALVLRPAAPTGGIVADPAPAGNVVVLPNGIAAPQLQPGSAPALVNDVSSANLGSAARDTADASTFKLTAENSNAANAVEAQAVMGCAGK